MHPRDLNFHYKTIGCEENSSQGEKVKRGKLFINVCLGVRLSSGRLKVQKGRIASNVVASF